MNEKQQRNDRTCKRLLDELKCDPEDISVWHITGEDPNCDLGGPHYNPDLVYIKGRLIDVIEYALELPKFFNWGYGGHITKIDVIELNAETNIRIKQLQEKQKQLTKELEDTNLALKDVGVI